MLQIFEQQEWATLDRAELHIFPIYVLTAHRQAYVMCTVCYASTCKTKNRTKI